MNLLSYKKRVFVGPYEVAGYYSNLIQELRLDGYQVTNACAQHKFSYCDEEQPYIVKKYNKLRADRMKGSSELINRLINIFLFNSCLIFYLPWAILKHDIFIFSFGASFFTNNSDLFILRLFGKHIISNIAHGSEARPPYIDGTYINNIESENDYDKLIKRTRKIKDKCRRIERYSNIVIAYPLTSQFLKERSINSFLIGIPFKLKEPISPDDFETKSDSFRILHCPSNPIVKGTLIIETVINKLKSEGFDIDFIKLEGKSNDEVLKEIVRSDLIVDQLYSDSCLPGFATEAAYFGKPSIIAGYAWDEIAAIINPEFLPPSNRCTPEELELKIKSFIEDKALLEDSGNALKLFMENQWNIKNVAKHYIDLIENNINEELLFDPQKVLYIYGSGTSKENLIQHISHIIQVYGRNSLQLSDRSDLEKKFLNLIKSQNKCKT